MKSEIKLIKYVFDDKYLFLKVECFDEIIDIEYVVKDVKFSFEALKGFILNENMKNVTKNFEKFFMIKTNTKLINEDWFKMLFYDYSFIRILIQDKIIVFDNIKEV